MRLVGLITLDTDADVATAELWLCGNGAHTWQYLREAIPKLRGERATWTTSGLCMPFRMNSYTVFLQEVQMAKPTSL